MRRKANPTVIGAFVLGAIVLVIAGIITFASEGFLQRKISAVAVFEGSIGGLKIGAPVTFRGAQVGQVTDIRIIINEDLTAFIPITMEFSGERRAGTVNRSRFESNTEEQVRALIDAGLRAQLAVQSLVTGQLTVALDLRPDTPATLRAPDAPHIEIPTVPSTMQDVKRAAGDIATELPELVDDGKRFLENLNNQLESGPLARTLENLEVFTANLADQNDSINTVIDDAATMMANLKDVSGRLDGLVDGADETLGSVRDAFVNINEIVEGNRKNLDNALQSIDSAAETIDAILQENRQGINDFVNVTLFEFSGLVTDTQQLVGTLNRVGEDLERDPARFFFGDQQQGFEGGQQ